MHPTDSHKFNEHEAAEYVGLSRSTLSKRRVFGGGPKYLKLGRRVVYETRDLDVWLNARRRASTSDAGDVATIPDSDHRDRASAAGSTGRATTPERKTPSRSSPARRGRTKRATAAQSGQTAGG
jgi:predicted DNA-binding transcriptional regulator AlpA